MGNVNGVCNITEAVEAALRGPFPDHVEPMCRCALGGTFLRDYVYRPFQYNYTYACNGMCDVSNMSADIMNLRRINEPGTVDSYSLLSDNRTLEYSATHSFPLCYETFTLLPNQVVEGPVLIAIAAIFYLAALLYLFVGVALIADRFMAAIEVSSEILFI